MCPLIAIVFGRHRMVGDRYETGTAELAPRYLLEFHLFNMHDPRCNYLELLPDSKRSNEVEFLSEIILFLSEMILFLVRNDLVSRSKVFPSCQAYCTVIIFIFVGHVL